MEIVNVVLHVRTAAPRACLSTAFDLDDDGRDGLQQSILLRPSATRRSTMEESLDGNLSGGGGAAMTLVN